MLSIVVYPGINVVFTMEGMIDNVVQNHNFKLSTEMEPAVYPFTCTIMLQSLLPLIYQVPGTSIAFHIPVTNIITVCQHTM